MPVDGYLNIQAQGEFESPPLTMKTLCLNHLTIEPLNYLTVLHEDLLAAPPPFEVLPSSLLKGSYAARKDKAKLASTGTASAEVLPRAPYGGGELPCPARPSEGEVPYRCAPHLRVNAREVLRRQLEKCFA